jgi:hypothetical protein
VLAASRATSHATRQASSEVSLKSTGTMIVLKLDMAFSPELERKEFAASP